jgi:hypothetical protein
VLEAGFQSAADRALGGALAVVVDQPAGQCCFPEEALNEGPIKQPSTDELAEAERTPVELVVPGPWRSGSNELEFGVDCCINVRSGASVGRTRAVGS